jgi:hypothetical protein
MFESLERAKQAADSTATLFFNVIITCSLLVAGFLAFPDHKVLFALFVCFIRNGLSTITKNTAVQLFCMHEIAVRESYQSTLLHKADNPVSWNTHDEFRQEVRRRVEGDDAKTDLERMWQDSPVSKLHLIGYLIKCFSLIVIIEVAYISVAFAISSQLQE